MTSNTHYAGACFGSLCGFFTLKLLNSKRSKNFELFVSKLLLLLKVSARVVSTADLQDVPNE